MKSTDIYTATIKITLRPSILDPQGESTLNALENLGYDNVSSVRIGKCIELKIDAESDLDARDTYLLVWNFDELGEKLINFFANCMDPLNSRIHCPPVNSKPYPCAWITYLRIIVI